MRAGEIARADLDILGLGLEVDRNPVITPVDVPAHVQTIFGGRTNDEAPVTPGLSAIGELTGPGILTPITLAAVPGRKFALPALHEQGEYALQNIRLVGENGEFLQQAVPSFAIITVSDVLKTEVRARQLTPEELRERGITVDARNFDVYEYTIVMGVGTERVEIPYPVIVDRRTNKVEPVTGVARYGLPPLQTRRPPRFSPPQSDWFTFGPIPDGGQQERDVKAVAPSIPAAIVMPTGFGVLHQYFAVILQVSNGAPDGSNIKIDNITATIAPPQQMRVAKVTPAVTLGQPVPIHDATTGATFLVAGAQGQAEWTLEALKTGTHSIDVVVEGFYQKPGQEDIPLRGRASTSVVVSDPRFQINFSHPDVVRADEEYTAYAFVTNLSPQFQHVMLDMSQIPDCSTGGGVDNICRLEGNGVIELDMQPGEMIPVPYRLTSKITGNVFAAAGSANDETLGVSVKLRMGVSESGVPLSAATLVMPHYARYVPNDLIAANLQLLGLGYSLATAPLTPYTAKFPRVITTDVFRRAQDIARAGQRIFITRQSREVDNPEENRDAMFHLALDLLGNIERVDHVDIAPDLVEWDELRRMEKSGRRAGAAMARQLEIHGLHNGRTPQQFVDDFAAATSHRSPFVFAYAHGADVGGQERPYALSLLGVTTNQRLDVPAEATTGWVRTMSNSELTRFDGASERGEMALVGRMTENMRVLVTPQSSSFKLHLIYPDTTNGSFLRSDIDITNATPGEKVWIDFARGFRTLVVNGASGSATVRDVPQTPLRVLGAAQDLHLNAQARLVSILFNRPLFTADVLTLRDRLALTTSVPQASYSVTRRNNQSGGVALQVPSAALQEDGKQLDVTFDKALSRNAQHVIAVDSVLDLVSRASFTDSNIIPRIDNERPGAILTGRVLGSDGALIPNAAVSVEFPSAPQLDFSGPDGRFLFEFIERDIDRNITGNYTLSAIANNKQTSLSGAVRLVGEVHNVDLVFLGRGTVRGVVRFDDGTPVPNALVTIGSALQNESQIVDTDANGRYELSGIAVGPITVVAQIRGSSDAPAFASTVLRTFGEVVTQDLVIFRREYRGSGTVRVTVRRADNNEVVEGAELLVATSGYSINEAKSDRDGFAEFKDVPAGLVTILAAQIAISNDSMAAIEVELKADQVLDQTIVLPTPTAPAHSNLIGVITRDDPAAPGDRSRDQVVPGAIVRIGRLPAVTADADGKYVYTDVPPVVADPRINAKMLVFDPATGRKGQFDLPSLLPGDVHYSVRLSSTAPEGFATVRVRLKSPTGAPVNGYRVMEPGFPPVRFTAKGDGIYELTGIQVPNSFPVVAVPSDREGPFGEQMAQGRVRVDFNGQVAILDLRLPGQGSVIGKVEARQSDESCAAPPCYAPALGRAALKFSVWDDFEQGQSIKTVFVDADPVTHFNTFVKIPALQTVVVQTEQNPAGFAAASTRLNFDGDAQNITLRLESLGDVTGRVFAHDRQTPIAGALVKLVNGSFVFGSQATKPDGSFRFPAVPAALSFQVVAEQSRDGIYRTGSVNGSTPSTGGPVSNLVIVMREQSTIEGQIVDAAGNPVPLAFYWARELWWPSRAFGSAAQPLQADINGRFILQNVFTGPFRISAKSPTIQEVRGDYQGTLAFEGDTSQQNVKVRIDGVGTGSLSISVVDSLQAFKAMPNAEVTILRGGSAFDVSTTDDRGIVEFHDVVAGTYTVAAYSKAVGRAGSVGGVTVNSGETTTRQIALEFLGKVAGRVTDPESEPIPDAPGRGMAVQVDSRVSLRESTDGEGKFSMLGIPEGPFSIYAYDFETGRFGFGPSGLFISKIVQEHNDIHLQLERTATLRVKAFLPNDAGGAGELAPLVAVSVEAGEYLREQQGNNLAFPRIIPRFPYRIVVQELGGEHRKVTASGSFPANTFDHTHSVVFPSSGTVEVKVLDGTGQLVQDAEVRINQTTIFTTADGTVRLTGVPFGNVSVQAKKGAFGASSSGTLQSRSIPLQFTLNLGSSASVTGFVEAEEAIGVPSVGTRVVMNVTSNVAAASRLEALTGADGKFLFSAIPIGSTRLSFLYFGPDDTTIGAEQVVDVPNGTTGTYTVPPVKLDATPPRVMSIDPPANTTNVSPTSSVVVTFSEPISASFLNSQYFQLVVTDTNTQVGVSIQPSLRPDGTYQVRLVPPPPPVGQKFPLKSNVLYRVTVVAGVQDLTGNAIGATVGSNFITVNYTEPSVVSIDPPAGQPLPANASLRIKFNKAVDIASLDAGNGGVLKVEKLTTRGGTPVREIQLSRFLDPADPTVIVASVIGEQIEEASFYRLTVANVRDTQTPPNVQAEAKVVDFFSFDGKRPLASIVSPVGAGEKLISDVLYTATVSVVDEITGATSTDIDSVDWFDVNGTFLRRVTAPPFAYSFVAPSTTTTTTYTLQVSANDLSGNSSPALQAFTWEVAPNAAPANIVVTNTPASLYPTQSGSSSVTFTDEGLQVTVALELHGKKLDGTDLVQALGSKQVSRASVTAAWPAASFNYTLPLDLQAGMASVVAKVSDVARTGTGQAALEVLNDVTAPEVLSFTPAPETRFAFDTTYTIELKVRDLETGIKSFALTVAGVDIPPAQIQHTVSNGVHTYRHTARVPAKNADTRIAIVAKSFDNRDNQSTSTTEVIYERVDDATIPQAAWVTPLDQAAMPFGIGGWQATLRIRATDDKQVTSVEFMSDAFASPVAAVTTPKIGTIDVFEAKAIFNLPANGVPFVVTARVHDADPNHTVELPITLRPVVLDPAVPSINTSSSISSLTALQYENKSLVVRGSGVRVTITVPLSIKDLIVLDGAAVSTFEEAKLDLTIAENVFVDADSKVDVSDKGYLGAHRVREDNALRNDTDNGRTLDATVGATGGAAGSYAGVGGEPLAGFTNATYGSALSPADLGSGGAGSGAAGNGGGAVLLRGSTASFVVAGGIHADGGTGVGRHGAGSGGAVFIDARTLITGPSTRVTVNGGDEDSSATNSGGGGGGRLAVRVADRFDVAELESRFRAHGGRNGATDGAQFIDGGAGTFFLSRPGATAGELIASSFDARQPSSAHRTRGTVLSSHVEVEKITIGPRALARFDVPQTAPITVDATATVVGAADLPQASIVTTVPATGAQVAQSTSITSTFTAQSLAGITRARLVLSAQPNDTLINLPLASTLVPETQATVSIPAVATAGTTTLKIVVTDRAGRIAESAPISFSIVSNAAPVIDSFVVTPADQIYAGGTIAVSATASDDVEVKSLTLTSNVGAVTSQTPTKPTPKSMARQFSVALPKTTASGTSVVLTLSASDDFPNRAATTAQHSIVIRRDEIAPLATITKPTANQELTESSTGTFTIEVSATDAEVGVNTVLATLEGTQYTLQPVVGQPGLYSISNVPIPPVDGSEPVTKTIAVSVTDFELNTTTKSVTILVRPLLDPNAPKVSWICGSPNAMYPVGYAAPLRVLAEGSSAQNGVQRVDFSIDGGAPIAATAVGANQFAASVPIPSVPAETVLQVRAKAVSASGHETTLLGTITVIAGFDISIASEIPAGDLAFENRTIIVHSGGVLTITGPHTLANLVVLDGGKVVQKHVDAKKADLLSVGRLFVSCNGSIDVSGQGFGVQATYPGSFGPQELDGGSHLGRGGNVSEGTATYGSVYRPQEKGAGSWVTGVGGGVIRLAAEAIVLEGAIRANGTNSATNFRDGGGAGGSIWITTGRVSGSGTIETNGGVGCGGSGGGGAVSFEYTDPTSIVPQLSARGGPRNNCGGSIAAASGTIYVKGPQSTHGDLTIEAPAPIAPATDLPSLGGGIAQTGTSGSTLVTDRTSTVPEYFVGHWVRIATPDGMMRGTWRIGSVNGKTVVLEANAAEALDIQPGDRWQGLYRFDAVTVSDTVLVSGDPIESNEQVLRGAVTLDRIRAQSLTVRQGAVVTHPSGESLDVVVENELRVEANGSIDASGKGFGVQATDPGAFAPQELDGGSHLGRGGNVGELGATYGSVYRPQERGAGSWVTGVGGGVIRIAAGSLVVDGTIRSNGTNAAINFRDGGGAGGSIWITTGHVSGAGTIETNGGNGCGGTGGGGALSLEYTNAASVRPTLLSRTGARICGAGVSGASGTIYVKGPQSIYGDVTIEATTLAPTATELPALGSGIAQSGTSGATLVTDRATNAPDYFVGHWVEIISAGSVIGTWRVASVHGKTVVLVPNAGEQLSIQPGDAWRGVYRFDNVKLRSSTVLSTEPVLTTNPVDKDAASQLLINAGAPQFPIAKRSQIVIDNTAGDAVIGPAGAVVDTDTPIKMTARNVRTSATFTANANVDGSFRIPVIGVAGDTFTLNATDSHAAPLTSTTIPVNGAIVETNTITSFSIEPSRVSGGTTAFGSVRLASPARATGATIVLSSSDSTASVPASVVVPGGNSTIQFPITTTSSAAEINAVINATLGSSTVSATLTIQPASSVLADVVLDSTTIEGGASVNGTVILGALAPSGGALVMLSSSSPDIEVPATVLVSEGNSQASFSVRTARVEAPTAGVITATWGASDSAALSLTACTAMGAVVPPSSTSLTTMWIDDAAPSGAAASGEATFDETQVARGTKSIHFAPPTTTTTRSFIITGAAPLAITPADEIVIHALINPCNPPRQILATWSDGTTQWRASWGESRIDPTLAQRDAGAIPVGGEWTRLSVIARSIGITSNKNISALTISVDGGEAWLDAVGANACVFPRAEKPAYLANEVVWFDDNIPAGSTLGVPFDWDINQAASGNASNVLFNVAGWDGSSFTFDPNGLKVNVDDVIVTYVLVDPCNPPREILLQFFDGTNWNRRAFWGENLLDSGNTNTVERIRLGAVPEPGRWLRLEIPVAGMQMAGMTLRGMAMDVFGGRVWIDRVGKASRINLALNKPTTQSSTLDNNPAAFGSAKSVDGDLTNISHTLNNVNTWWEVDLGAVQPIDSIDVWNRSDCCQSRESKFYVLVSDTPFTSTNLTTTLNQAGVSAYYHQRVAARPSTFKIDRTGRYVRFQLSGQDFVNLSEVQVWAPVEARAVNVSGGKMASQSSTLSDGNGAYLAAQGVNGNAFDGNFSHTNNEAQAWWQVDLGSIQAIDTIDVNNVFVGGPSDRMSNFYLFVSDTPFTSNTVAGTLAQAGVYAVFRGSPLTAYTYRIGRTGRYVRLQLTGTNWLHPMEVTIASPSLRIGALARPSSNADH